MDIHTTGDAESWARIGKSTIFDLVLNANIVTSDFIESEMPTDDVSYYKPTLSQELQANAGDPCFDFLYDMFFNLPTGEEIKKQALFVFAGAESPFKAWKCEVSVILKDFNTVEEKILFDLNINSIEKGTAIVTDAGVPTFTAAE